MKDILGESNHKIKQSRIIILFRTSVRTHLMRIFKGHKRSQEVLT